MFLTACQKDPLEKIGGQWKEKNISELMLGFEMKPDYIIFSDGKIKGDYFDLRAKYKYKEEDVISIIDIDDENKKFIVYLTDNKDEIEVFSSMEGGKQTFVRITEEELKELQKPRTYKKK